MGVFIMSENIQQVPLNAAGALEIGIWPCTYCESGWSFYSRDKSETCQTECEYVKQYNKETTMRDSKTAVDPIEDGQKPLYNQVLCPCCDGRGYQHNIQTNINEPCRCCDGGGVGLPGQGNIKITTIQANMEAWDMNSNIVKDQ